MLVVSNHRKQTTGESTPMHKSFEIKKQPRKVIAGTYIRATWHMHGCILDLAVKHAGSVFAANLALALIDHKPNSPMIHDLYLAVMPLIDANSVLHDALSETECKRAFDPFRESTKNDLRWLAYAEAEVARLAT